MHRSLIVMLVAVAVVMAGCGGDSDPDADAQIIEVTLTDNGCEPAAITAQTGEIDFHVTNDGSGAVTEFEILDAGNRVLGEVENVAPGLHREFTMTLDAGSYVTYCPGGANERGTLDVSG